MLTCCADLDDLSSVCVCVCTVCVEDRGGRHEDGGSLVSATVPLASLAASFLALWVISLAGSTSRRLFCEN